MFHLQLNSNLFNYRVYVNSAHSEDNKARTQQMRTVSPLFVLKQYMQAGTYFVNCTYIETDRGVSCAF